MAINDFQTENEFFSVFVLQWKRRNNVKYYLAVDGAYTQLAIMATYG